MLAEAAVRLQAAARGMGTRAAIERHKQEEAAAMLMQATVRGNMARGIAERKKYEAMMLPRRRLVHPGD